MRKRLSCLLLAALLLLTAGCAWRRQENRIPEIPRSSREEKDFSRETKRENKKNEHISAVYWGAALVIYLAWSFITMEWHRTWIVWPIAGVGYGVVIAVLRMIRSKN